MFLDIHIIGNFGNLKTRKVTLFTINIKFSYVTSKLTQWPFRAAHWLVLPLGFNIWHAQKQAKKPDIASPGSWILPVCLFYQPVPLPLTLDERRWLSALVPGPSISSCIAVSPYGLPTNSQFPIIFINLVNQIVWVVLKAVLRYHLLPFWFLWHRGRYLRQVLKFWELFGEPSGLNFNRKVFQFPTCFL